MAASGGPAERRASSLIGMPVVSADGSPLGEVKDIILDSQGRATHVVIAYQTQSQAGPAEIPEGKPESGADSKLVAVPWDTIIARITDDRVVLDGANLQGAPSFAPGEWPDLADPTWSSTADAYWRKVARPPAAAHRSTPIDSTARLRARPPRDGDDN
ncbi:MAG TPA: PRC-barrel domain-containing protein [Steroidobacteraceae bacterium]|nr:PRC-barrel domain-containing protein [Steroidobacteraceae bacterium]